MKKDIFKQLKQEYENEMQFKDSLSNIKGRLSFRENKRKKLPLRVLVPVSTLLAATTAGVCAVVISFSISGDNTNAKANGAEETENAAPVVSADMTTVNDDYESSPES